MLLTNLMLQRPETNRVCTIKLGVRIGFVASSRKQRQCFCTCYFSVLFVIQMVGILNLHDLVLARRGLFGFVCVWVGGVCVWGVVAENSVMFCQFL